MPRTSDRPSFFGKLLLCVALLGWPAAATANAADPTPVAAPKPPSVSIATAASGTLAETILLTGTLVARDEVMVGAEIDGLAITELLAEEGDKVTRGQVLARLSRDMLDAQFAQNAAALSRALAAIAQARNQIAEAEATARQADAAFARARSLEERGNTTAETLEQREALSPVPAFQWLKTPCALPRPTRKWRKLSARKSRFASPGPRSRLRPPAR
jgi:HlyD family secretion protein